MANSNWILDKSKSNIRFKVKHLLIASVQGEFSGFEVDVKNSGKTILDASINVSINSASINTRLKKRDAHLLSRDFLNGEEFPEIKFNSRAVKEVREETYKLIGELSLLGVSKEVEIIATVLNNKKDKVFRGFSIEADIKRQDFGINWSNDLEGKWPLVDDVIKLYGNIYFREKEKGDIIKGVAGRLDVQGNEKYKLFSTRKGKQNGSFAWNQVKGGEDHWLFGNSTGDSNETHFRALKSKLYVESLTKEYDHIKSPSQFLRVLHFSLLEDTFLAQSVYDNNTFSLDACYLMIDSKARKIKYSSARMTVLLLKTKGIKVFPKNNISLGYSYYNIGQLVDHTISYEPGDTLILFNDELIAQQGGSNGKKLGAKTVANLMIENRQKEWGKRTNHLSKVLEKWIGDGKSEDIIIAQIKL